MGRITIFSSDGCPHCRRCFAALEQRNIPYTEISITQFPNRRADMLSLSMKLSTPQVFFNTRHVGGADDAIKLLEKWDKQVITRKKYYSAYDRYQAEIANFADPADKRFAVPDCDPVQPEPGPPRVREEEYSVILPDGKTTTVLQVTKTLKKLFIIDDHQSGMTVYKNSFTGEQAVKALTTHYGIPESAAVYFGQELQEQHHILVDVLGRENVKFDNTSTGFFRLQCSQTPDVLNSFRVWTERVDPDPMRLICRLKKMLEKIEIDVMDDDGKVDFRSAQVHKLYSIFEEAVCELQGVKLYKMNDNTKTAFGLNLYNMMIKFAFIKVGVGTTVWARNTFYGTVKFNVGGHLYSFQDWENGILRGNRKAPHGLSAPFGRKDPRYKLMVKKPDPRIHFGLNCGARSCPPVVTYSADHLDEELTIVAASFCEDSSNVQIDAQKREIHVSKIFDWYRQDFVDSTNKLPKKLCEYMRGIKQQTLERMLDSGKPVKVFFQEYDWSTNASDQLIFDADSLKPNQKRARNLLNARAKRRSSLDMGYSSSQYSSQEMAPESCPFN